MGVANSTPAPSTHTNGESFRLQLNGYFTEQQQGRTLNLLLEYGYDGVLPLEMMPDYRLIQLLVEDVLYVYPREWLDIFWEITNREMVRRLLEAFPQISWVRCEMSVMPSSLLPISRTSVVHWQREDVQQLGPGLRSWHRPLPDACYYASPAPAFNIGAPRYLLSSLTALYKRLAADAAKNDEDDDDTMVVALSFVPTCLEATEGTYDELLALCAKHGVYDALILPRCAKHDMHRLLPVGKLSGLVEVVSSPAAGKSTEPTAGGGGGGAEEGSSGSGVAEHLLHALLGRPHEYSACTHAAAREKFFVGTPEGRRSHRMLMEERFSAPLTLRDCSATPAYEGEALELCVPATTTTTTAAAASDAAGKDAACVAAAVAKLEVALKALAAGGGGVPSWSSDDGKAAARKVDMVKM